MNVYIKNIVRIVGGVSCLIAGGTLLFTAGCQHATSYFDITVKKLDPDLHKKLGELIFK